MFVLKNIYRFFVLLFVLFSCTEFSNSTDMRKESLEKLDQLIEQKENFRRAKESRISDMKKGMMSNSVDQLQKYKLQNDIIEEYLGYQSDSAMHYVYLNHTIAKSLGNNILIQENEIKKSVVLTSTGMFTEAMTILNEISPTLDSSLEFNYNSAMESLYSNLFEYTNDNPEFSEIYGEKLLKIYRKAYSTSKEPLFSYLFQYNIHKVQGNWKVADENIDLFIQNTPKGSRLQAIGYYCKGFIAEQKGDLEAQIQFLSLSAIADIQSATTENRSLQELAFALYKAKDYTRAYRYLQAAMDDANFYNARFRNFQISQVHPIIEEGYLEIIKNKNTKLTILVIFSLISVALLIFFTYYISRQLKLISSAKRETECLNKKLNIANVKLSEVSHVKDVYMAFFVNQSVKYLNNFERFKKIISVSADSRNIEKINKLINDRKKNDDEIEAFYQDFDKAFLSIYPTFFNQINHIMKPEFQYPLDHKLNTEMRILALIRMGIVETQQISDFLQFSIRTIYNYRSKIKSKTLIQHEDFENVIMNIDDQFTN